MVLYNARFMKLEINDEQKQLFVPSPFIIFGSITLYPRISSNVRPRSLDLEKLLDDANSILRASDGVANCSLVAIDFVVVAANEGLVAEEVDCFVGDAIRLLRLVLEMLEAVGLIPAGGEDVEGDLAADREAIWGVVS